MFLFGMPALRRSSSRMKYRRARLKMIWDSFRRFREGQENVWKAERPSKSLRGPHGGLHLGPLELSQTTLTRPLHKGVLHPLLVRGAISMGYEHEHSIAFRTSFFRQHQLVCPRMALSASAQQNFSRRFARTLKLLAACAAKHRHDANESKN